MDFKKFEKLNNSKILSDNSPLIKKKDTFFEMNRESALNKKPNDKKKLTTSLIHQQNAPKILNMTVTNFEEATATEDKPSDGRNRRVSIKDKIKYYESQMEEIERLKQNSSLLGIAKKYGIDADYTFLENNKAKGQKILEKNKDTTFLAEVQNLFDDYEAKINTANTKINEILKENYSLKSKLQTQEETFKKEIDLLKKNLVEALEKVRYYEKIHSNDREDSRKNSLKSNLQSSKKSMNALPNEEENHSQPQQPQESVESKSIT